MKRSYMRMIAFTLSFLIAAAAVIAQAPFVSSYDYTSFDQKIEEIKKEYPENSTWSSANQYPAGWSGCWGFANMLADRIFGTKVPRDSWKNVSVDDVRPGDIISTDVWNGSYWTFNHTMFVIKVEGDTVTVGEGNYAGKVRWTRSFSKYSETFLVYRAPNYDDVIASPEPKSPTLVTDGWGYLPGQSVTITPDAEGMTRYSVSVVDSMGNTVFSDTTGSLVSPVTFTPEKTGIYSVNVRIYGTGQAHSDVSCNFIVSKPVDIPDGEYYISSSFDDNLVMSTEGRAQQASKIILEYAESTSSQIFSVIKTGDFYSVTNKASGMAIDVVYEDLKGNVDIMQHAADGTDYQRWRFMDAGDGYVYIQSALGPFAEIENSTAPCGSDIRSAPARGTEVQKWKLIPSGALKIKKTFSDVSYNEYYFRSVEWAIENGITAGTGENTFSPNDPCTRAQAVTFLWRSAGCPEPEFSNNPFTDVPSGEYYTTAVIWALENHITAGTSATSFSPGSFCTRAQIVTFIYRMALSPANNGNGKFTDVDPDSYYYIPVGWAVDNGITAGTSETTFSPGKECTRAQIVTFLYRYFR